jgi:hypothetical protein
VGEPSRVERAREPEVGQRGDTVGVEQHVRRLDVTVQDPDRVQRVQSATELRGEVGRLGDADWTEGTEPAGERRCVQRHDEVDGAVRLTQLQDRDDVAGLDLCGDSRLPEEAGAWNLLVRALGTQDLDGDAPGCLVDEPGRALTQQFLEPVARDLHRAIIPGGG